MKKLANKTKNNNVLSITKSPRFQPESDSHFVMIPKNESSDNFASYRLSANLFGYPSGTIMITRTVFSLSEIGHTTLVLTEDKNGIAITAGQTENVIGIVDYIQIDLRRAQ